MSEEKKKPGLVRRALGAGLGALVLAFTGYVYATTLAAGSWPIGHPWSGIALGSLGASLVAGGADNPVAKTLKWLGRAATAGSGGMWAFRTWWS